MNKKLADVAKDAVTAPKGFERVSGYCQRFTRQCVQKALGHRYDKYFASSAYETMNNFKGTSYAIKPDFSKPDFGTQVGDILYKGQKTSGKYGHVGVRVTGNRVAENSSSHIDEAGDRDARGFRSLSAFAPFELIVRLPD